MSEAAACLKPLDDRQACNAARASEDVCDFGTNDRLRVQAERSAISECGICHDGLEMMCVAVLAYVPIYIEWLEYVASSVADGEQTVLVDSLRVRLACVEVRREAVRKRKCERSMKDNARF